MKKTIARVLALSLLFGLVPVTALGVEEDVLANYSVEAAIYRAQNGISEIPVTAEMREMVSATLTGEDGVSVPVKVDITVEELPQSRQAFSAEGQGKTYAITAAASVAKTEYGESKPIDTSINVTAFATLVWTDNFGSNNLLNAVRGGWTNGPNSSVTWRKVDYYVRNGRNNEKHRLHYPTGLFEYRDINYEGEQLCLETFATVNGNSGNKESLILKVTSSIFS